MPNPMIPKPPAQIPPKSTRSSQPAESNRSPVPHLFIAIIPPAPTGSTISIKTPKFASPAIPKSRFSPDGPANNSPHHPAIIPKIPFSTFHIPFSKAEPAPRPVPSATRIRPATFLHVFRSLLHTHHPTNNHHPTGKATTGVPVQAPIKLTPYHPSHSPATA